MFMYIQYTTKFLSLSRCSLETTEQAERGRDGSDCHEDSAGALHVDCMYMYLHVHCMGVCGLQGAYIVIHTWKRGKGMCSTGGN